MSLLHCTISLLRLMIKRPCMTFQITTCRAIPIGINGQRHKVGHTNALNRNWLKQSSSSAHKHKTPQIQMYKTWYGSYSQCQYVRSRPAGPSCHTYDCINCIFHIHFIQYSTKYKKIKGTHLIDTSQNVKWAVVTTTASLYAAQTESVYSCVMSWRQWLRGQPSIWSKEISTCN